MSEFIDAEVVGGTRQAPSYYARRVPGRRPVMAGAYDGNFVSNYLSAAISDPAQQDALSDVLSQSARKFVVSPEGQEVVATTSWQAVLPAFVFGMVAGWMLTRGRS